MTFNSGISFGWSFPGMALVLTLMLVGVGYCWWREKEWGWGLILIGGGLNYIERLVTGGVIDYWKIPFTNIYNNINDYLIFFGCVWLIINKWKKLK